MAVGDRELDGKTLAKLNVEKRTQESTNPVTSFQSFLESGKFFFFLGGGLNEK